MRRALYLLLLCCLTGSTGLLCARNPGENADNYPAVAPGNSAIWTEITREALRLLHNDTAVRQAYLLRPAEEATPNIYRLDYSSGDSAVPSLTPAAVREHNLTVKNAVPAFGATEDTLSFRSFATAGGNCYYFAADGLPREMAVSPDGISLALTDRGHNAIWLWQMEEDEPVQMTKDKIPGFDKQAILQAGKTKEVEGWSLNWAERPCWSPDGGFIYYLSTRTSGGASRGTALWRLDRAAGREELVCSRKSTFLDILGWAGPHLLLAGGDGSILSYNPANQQADELLNNVHPVSLAPDGSRLLFQKLDRRSAALISPQLYAFDPANGTESVLPVLPPGYRFNAAGSWSPDGQRFAFLAYHGAAPWDSILAIVTFFRSEPEQIDCYGPPAAVFDQSLPPAWLGTDRLICVTREPEPGQDQPVTWLLAAGGGDNIAAE